MASRADTLLRVESATGASATFSAFGARLVELRVPDRDGRLDNVVLGFDDERRYREHVDLYFGATIGRVCGRIAGARFQLEGREVRLTPNEGTTHLHGGPERAFDRVDWAAEPFASEHGRGVAFTYVSPDGEEGYPGELRARAEYLLSDDHELRTVFRAIADVATPVNMTNHAYWNLAGAGRATILDHELAIDASSIVALDDDLVPTGGLQPVDATALDFRRPRRLGAQLPDTDEPWPGFDAAYVLDATAEVAVTLRDPRSGRVMEIRTSEPSIQMYTANRVPRMTGRDGRPYGPGGAICLEPQRMPDAVNRPEFDSIVVPAGQEYRHVSTYRFTVR